MSLSPFVNCTADDLSGIVRKLQQEYHIPGIAVAIINNNTIQDFYFGVANAETQQAVDRQTKFRIASLNKPVFAYLCHLLIAYGKLDPHLPLQSYLSEPYTTSPYLDQITAEHVLSHTTGFPNWAFNQPLVQQFEPGSRFQYSGEGYKFLQTVIETIMNQSIAEIMSQFIFHPLAMDNSYCARDDIPDTNISTGHDAEGCPGVSNADTHMDTETSIRLGSKYKMAGSMWSSAYDYASFLQHLLSQGPDILATMTTSTINIPDWHASWGLGIGLQQSNLGKAMWQWGSERYVKNFTITYLDHNYSVSIFCNGSNGKEVHGEIIQFLTGEFSHYHSYSDM